VEKLGCGWQLRYGFVLLFLGSPVWGISVCDQAVGQFASIQGFVEVQANQTSLWAKPAADAALCEGDTVRVGELSRAEVALINDSVLRIDQNTTIRLLDIAENPTEHSLLALLQGAFASLSRKPRRMTVSTPYVNGTIEGTEFLMSIAGTQAEIRVLEGSVVAANDQGSVTLGPGEAAVAAAGSAPVRHLMVRPRDAVHWALYYQPVLNMSAEAWPAGPGWEGVVGESVDAYLKGNLQSAFAILAKVPETVDDASLLAYRASLFLSVGRVEKANADIERILAEHPNDGDALALKTIVAVAQGDKTGALEIGSKAVSVAPESTAALIALSYAEQAEFDLEGARASIERAVLLDQDNALAWARLAELHLSFGARDKALVAANKAAALQPGLSRTQTVLGFAHLTRSETSAALAAFQTAIRLDQGDPLPRLGLGLATIRDGKLSEGRRELEIAASLDPNNALIRSYLGKAYFEEKRDALVDREYATAHELDPKDPTPLFYSAIHRQTTNRPAEALADMQEAIELNDSRAVYRSRLLLDSDLAARSASQARIYTDLGFDQLALVEGWKSVNTDPSNHSAHRLLADSYAGQPRHEIARVSELLQSQLLQPLNMTPLSPQLSESNLFLIGAGGPAALGFNEYNQVFSSDGLTLQTSALGGENDTHGEDAVVSGIYRNFSFSVGGFHYRTDGFRDNADQSDDMANAFVQVQLSPATSIQAEYRYRDNEQGDLQQRFFKEDVFDTLRNMQEKESVRLGARHDLTPNSTLLASFVYQDSQIDAKADDFPVPDGFFKLGIPEESLGAELQHLYRTEFLDLRTGAGAVDLDRKENQSFGFPAGFFGPDPFVFGDAVNASLKHFNGYSYADIRLLDQLTATLGLSYDNIDRTDADDKDELNPKFGLTWTPLSGTTVRAAAFKVLKRSLITDQTLEPTQVAGFNQFYDDVNLTEAWRYGAALDQKFAANLFGGVELSARDLKVPVARVGPEGLVDQELDWREYASRLYLFSTPSDRVSLKAEYIFERFDRDTLGPEKLITHRVPLGVRFFDPSGLGGYLTATYWNQDGRFAGFSGPDQRSGRDQFWLVDAGVSFRLPKRYGLLSIGATNLTDEDFRFFEVDFDNPTILPKRSLVARITLAFP
jgi:Flp pilus assembly protein TadD